MAERLRLLFRGRDLSAEMVKLGLALGLAEIKGHMRFETVDARKRLFLADARMKGRMDVWRRYEARMARM